MPSAATAATNVPAKEVENVNDFPIDGEMINGLWNGKWQIHDPRKVKYVERTEFLRSICGQIDAEDKIEDLMAAYPRGNKKHPKARFDLQNLANTYVLLRNKGARLPKFTRWVTGMFAGNAEYAKLLAEEGQRAANRKIVMSVDIVDILRNAATPHFYSCFAYAYGGGMGGFGDMPKKIVEQCPGIGIVYVDDADGMMMGRLWMHHAKIKETGEDMIVLPQSQYGCLQANNVARLMAERGVKVGIGEYYDEDADDDMDVEVEYIGCFTSSVHHDLRTWGREKHFVRQVQPNFTTKK